jgi:DNA-binding GntR family transcriptional regulator
VISANLRSRKKLSLMPARVGQLAVTNHRLIARAIEGREAEKAEALTRQLIEVAAAEMLAELGEGPGAR